MSDAVGAREGLWLTCVTATERLVDALARHGFVEQVNVRPPKWRGLVKADSHSTVVDVTIPQDYPFSAPRVTPLTQAAAEIVARRAIPNYWEVSNSWHLERGDRMCLFENEDHTRLPWADPKELLDQVRAWLTQDANGWPDDHPALDLERYLTNTGEVLLFENLDEALGKVVRFKRGPLTSRIDRLAKLPRGSRGVRGRWQGSVALVLDIGEVLAPIRGWDSLVTAAGASGDKLTEEVQYGVRTVVLRYTRGNTPGVLAVRLTESRDSWSLAALQTAPQDAHTLQRRAHPNHQDLAKTRVAVVGVGAIGSVLADLLHRSGVGSIDLYDADIVKPGNVVRHLVDASHSGKTKAEAVTATLRRARPGSPTLVTAHDKQVTTLDEAIDVLMQFDLVVDATADSTASPMLAAVARAGGGRVVSVAVLADGYAVRVDHHPGDEPALIELPDARPGGYETGCSSPVSTTPPTAVWEAASLGARHTIDKLLGSNPSGQTYILRQGGVP